MKPKVVRKTFDKLTFKDLKRIIGTLNFGSGGAMQRSSLDILNNVLRGYAEDQIRHLAYLAYNDKGTIVGWALLKPLYNYNPTNKKYWDVNIFVQTSERRNGYAKAIADRLCKDLKPNKAGRHPFMVHTSPFWGAYFLDKTSHYGHPDLC